MVSFTPLAPRYPTVQKYGRQLARGPITGALNMLKIILTDFHYPKTIAKGLFFLGIFAVPLILRESAAQADAKKGSPWNRIIEQREKEAAARQ